MEQAELKEINGVKKSSFFGDMSPIEEGGVTPLPVFQEKCKKYSACPKKLFY